MRQGPRWLTLLSGLPSKIVCPLLVALLASLLGPRRALAADDAKPPETEIGVAPFAGGDSDVGFGVGQLSAIARFEEGYAPYRWRLESSFRP